MSPNLEYGQHQLDDAEINQKPKATAKYNKSGRNQNGGVSVNKDYKDRKQRNIIYKSYAEDIGNSVDLRKNSNRNDYYNYSDDREMGSKSNNKKLKDSVKTKYNKLSIKSNVNNTIKKTNRDERKSRSNIDNHRINDLGENVNNTVKLMLNNDYKNKVNNVYFNVNIINYSESDQYSDNQSYSKTDNEVKFHSQTNKNNNSVKYNVNNISNNISNNVNNSFNIIIRNNLKKKIVNNSITNNKNRGISNKVVNDNRSHENEKNTYAENGFMLGEMHKIRKLRKKELT